MCNSTDFSMLVDTIYNLGANNVVHNLSCKNFTISFLTRNVNSIPYMDCKIKSVHTICHLIGKKPWKTIFERLRLYKL